MFFDYWTLKEAYIKARGLGLALPLGQFTFIRTPDAAPAIAFAPELHDDPASWQFAQFWPTRDHRMAVAVRRHGRRPSDRGRGRRPRGSAREPVGDQRPARRLRRESPRRRSARGRCRRTG